MTTKILILLLACVGMAMAQVVQPPANGAASSIPASGVTAGTFPAGAFSFTTSAGGPTPAASDNSTLFSTTAYVTTAISNAVTAAAGRDLVTAATNAVLPNTPTFTSVAAGIGSFYTSSTNSALVVDGYTALLNDRILVKDQATAARNGIYKVTQLGVAAVTPWIITRALDYDQASDINNTLVPVANNGTANPKTSWIQTATVATVDTDTITFAAFTPAGTNIVTAVSPGVGLCHFAGSTQACTSSAVALASADVSGTLSVANGGAVAQGSNACGTSSLCATGSLNTSQILSLSTTPSIQLIAAQGAGTLIVIDSFYAELIFGGTAFAAGSGPTLYYGAVNTCPTGNVTLTTSVTAGANTYARGGISGAATGAICASSAVVNTAIDIGVGGASFTTGNGSLSYWITYRVLTGL